MRARAYVPVVFVWYRKQQYCLPPIHPEVYAVGWCSFVLRLLHTHLPNINTKEKSAKQKQIKKFNKSQNREMS